jgi:hypothetical protein
VEKEISTVETREEKISTRVNAALGTSDQSNVFEAKYTIVAECFYNKFDPNRATTPWGEFLKNHPENEYLRTARYSLLQAATLENLPETACLEALSESQEQDRAEQTISTNGPARSR